jgi:hypothetical protein
MTLLGCATGNNFANVKEVGSSFPRAQYEVKGKTRYDQIWISETISAEVAGFGFARPQRRPASYDAAPASHTVVVTPAKPATLVKASTPAVVTVVPKKHWWKRLRKQKP